MNGVEWIEWNRVESNVESNRIEWSKSSDRMEWNGIE